MKIWVLFDNAGNVVVPDTKVVDFRGEVTVLRGGKPPHKPSSTGRVWTDAGEFFPSVFGLAWKEV